MSTYEDGRKIHRKIKGLFPYLFKDTFSATPVM